MIVWLNGTFGVGKTALAYRLKGYYGNQSTVLESDILFQEEMKKVFEIRPKYGFPNINGLYPQDNLTFLNLFKNEVEEKNAKYKVVIVDMALTTERSRDILFKPLMDSYDDIVHFILEGDKDTIRERVLVQKERDVCYALSMFNESVQFLKNNYEDAIRVDTTLRSEIEVKNYVMEIIDLHMWKHEKQIY